MAFDPELAKKERWLVFNKLDLIDEEKKQSEIEQVIRIRTGETGPEAL